MGRRTGLQAEVLVSFAVAMLIGTGVLVVVLSTLQQQRLDQVRGLLAQALAEEARAPAFAPRRTHGGIRWWLVDASGRAEPRPGTAELIDAGSLALAAAAVERGAPLLRNGAAWQPIRFAMPLPGSDATAVAWMPAVAPNWLVLALLLADAAVLAVFGAYLLRRSLLLPLRRLAAAARWIAEGSFEARVPVEGVREAAEVASAFNAMSAALARRTGALEKAVTELSETNLRLREARAGLDRAERLAAVGRLAAGVAHEVGNPVGALLACLDLAQRDRELTPATAEHLDRAARQADRVRRILRQLLDFSRPPQAVPVPVDLLHSCQETAELVRAQRRYRDVAIEVVVEGDPPRAHADPAIVSQILLNLVLNAADAVREQEEARLRLTVRAAERGEGAASASRDGPGAVECEVADNGCGIPEADRERVFDAFYTSKDPGEGTGLGLSNALRLAEQLNGRLELLPSRPEGGSVFALRLPVADGD